MLHFKISTNENLVLNVFGWVCVCNQMGPKDTDSVTNIVRLRGVRGVEQQVSVIYGGQLQNLVL